MIAQDPPTCLINQVNLEGIQHIIAASYVLQEFGRVESSVTTKIKGVTRSHLDEDSEDDPGK